MFIQSTFLYYYVNILNRLYSLYYKLYSLFFKVENIKCYHYDNVQDIYLDYLLYKTINYIPYSSIIIDKIFHYNYGLVNITLFSNNTKHNIIKENVKMKNIYDIIQDFTYNINDRMMIKQFIITKMSLVDNSLNHKYNIKKILTKYSDKMKKYDHTLQNVFYIETIPYLNTDLIEIIYIHRYNRKKVLYNINDILNKHLLEILNSLVD